ncbi:MAG: M48 family metalloprotease [Bacteroidia bacterium]|nr:M48 family metalloprotease [Bacteroidia bacterium]
MKSLKPFAAVLLLCILLPACSGGSGSINLFSVQDDIKLGREMRDEILNNTVEYKIWSREKHPDAYLYLDSLRNEIMRSGKVEYRDAFDWELYIIKDNGVENAFCLPGGYIFVYTGLVQGMKSEDELAGVLAHEIAHADRRHSTAALTKEYGVGILLSIILGEDYEMVSRLVGSMISLEYSRDNEKEADRKSVEYLCNTRFDAAGSARYFKKLSEDDGEQEVPEFVSTHPSHENRVSLIEEEKKKQGCEEKKAKEYAFTHIKALFE